MRNVKEMRYGELVAELESLEFAFEMARQYQSGISTKETIRHRELKAAVAAKLDQVEYWTLVGEA